jgi:diguanylate cyclase (GGDEF)-like protein
VNVLVFIAVSWIASRILYSRYCTDFKSTLLLKRANEQLELEIARNHEANLQLADANRQLQLLSLQDELTGLPNRRSFRNFVERMFDEGVPAGTPFSVAMIDLDHFKEFNDSYGHNGGDMALAAVAGEIKSVVRHSKDIAARWGGEEFVYAAFGMDAGEIEAVAETIRMRVAALAIPHCQCEDSGIVTVSVGACTNPVRDKSDVSKCIDRADKAMYRAKAGGRNRTQNHESPRSTGRLTPD